MVASSKVPLASLLGSLAQELSYLSKAQKNLPSSLQTLLFNCLLLLSDDVAKEILELLKRLLVLRQNRASLVNSPEDIVRIRAHSGGFHIAVRLERTKTAKYAKFREIASEKGFTDENYELSVPNPECVTPLDKNDVKTLVVRMDHCLATLIKTLPRT